MPLAKFTRENTQSGPEIPRLKLEKDEKARVVILDEGPQYRWYHRLEKIALLGQRPKMVTRERRNGETYEVYDTDFVGTPACTGDPEVLEQRGVDPDNCVICAASRKYPDAIEEPKRRFAMNVFKYQTKPGSSELQVPFGGTLLVWSFTEKRFSVLVDIAEEFGDLRTTDLVLGPCSNAQFQNFEIHGSPKAAWMSNDETKAYTASVYKENKFSDAELMDLCAKVREERYVKEDLEMIIERWEHVARWEAGDAQVSASAAAPAEKIDVADALSDLFNSSDSPTEADTEVKTEPISRPTTSVTDDLDALLEAPTEAPAEPKEEISGITDLDDLLK
jgi:hypothetical protein